ncbi:hypothetical protein FQA47_003959 [Oryzias melastigma]|uniref:Uncharacterized protein n=1 Tax=Oryzias melastigma TaxID=30732 RepID=A0A834F6Z1_ORYME|nr:hypothetical protein FQA47_003959 [Oryzias melastigma]
MNGTRVSSPDRLPQKKRLNRGGEERARHGRLGLRRKSRIRSQMTGLVLFRIHLVLTRGSPNPNKSLSLQESWFWFCRSPGFGMSH